MEFKDFFNCYDTVGTQHTGFLQSMDFSALTTKCPFLNELTMAFMDAHLYNELSGSLVMRQWAQYMHFDKTDQRFEIMATFYTDFVNALAAKLMRAQKWYELTQIDFQSLSATDIKTIEHGLRETVNDYGEAETTRAYGEDEHTNVYGSQENTNAYGVAEKTNVYGQQQNTNAYGVTETTNLYGATQQTQQHGAQTIQKDYDKVVVSVQHGQDTHVVGAAHTESDGTTTNQIYPLGAAAYADDNKSIVHNEGDTDAQTNTDTFGDVDTETDARQDGETLGAHTDTISDVTHTDTITDAAHTDTITSGTHTDTLTDAAHTDTLTNGAHTDTLTRSEREDVETRGAHQDVEKIKAYTDTERHTKYIVISPDKYYQIEKELTEIGVYDLMRDAVRETMLLCVWEGGYIW